MDIFTIAENYQNYLIEKRRWFHAHPELSGKEFHSSAAIKQELDKLGISWRPCGLDTGILATITGAKPGRTILLRGDMDALEVREQTGLPFASEVDGVMHACGHDCHMAMLLTAARILNDMRGELCGTVELAFQPAEEIAAGALSMIEQGALDGVDGCFAIHVWSDIERGRVFCPNGAAMASAGRFRIDIQGAAGHGATPQLCVDAAVAASATVMNLQTVVSRELSPLEPSCVTVGRIRSGTRFNCVAGTAEIEGTTRAFSKAACDQFEPMIRRIAEETARTFRASAVLHYDELTDPVVNDPNVAALVRQASCKVVAENALIDIPPLCGGEDFAYFMGKCPGAIALLGVRSEACGAVWPQHSDKYCVDEEMLLRGAMLYAQTALDFNAETK